MKNIFLLTFLFLLFSCGPETAPPSDWSEVDTKIRAKDSLGALKLAKKVAPAVETWAGYPDVYPKPDSSKLEKDTQTNLQGL